MFSRPGQSKFVKNFGFSKLSFSLSDFIAMDEKADLSKYPFQNVWNHKNGKIVRITKSYIKEIK